MGQHDKLLTDEQIIEGVLENDSSIIEYFFNKKCSGLFSYILMNVFNGNIDKRELVSELYLFMAKNNWQVFRKFKYRSSLMTYVSVVAVRFFQKKRFQMLDFQYPIDLNNKICKEDVYGYSIESKIDLQSALKNMPNVRYRKVIKELDLCDVDPGQLAEEMNVTVDNLYNIHRRALVQLRLVMGRKEDYV